MAGEIFISYRRSDAPKARLLQALLKARGIDAWCDALLGAGEDWRTATARALEAAPIFVLLFSENASTSDDIITDLSKVSALWVAARNTAFTFKGKHVDVPSVARQLKVSHVLEGSVRKSGNRVRIPAQLIDATGGHVWAERYDRNLDDILAARTRFRKPSSSC